MQKMKKTTPGSICKAMAFSITVLLLVWSHFTDATNSLCPAVCACDEGLNKIDCSRAYLSIVPPVDDWPITITDMDLSSNNISALDTELAHPTLEVLDLSNNRIATAIQYAFGGLTKLKYLNLANNMISSFDDNGFYGLDHLLSLNISGNNLHAIPDRLLYNFIGLQELSLANNPLTHIDPIHLNRMVALKWLDLTNTNLYSLQPHIFHTTAQLQFLDLSSNDFHEVPTDALRSAKSLKHLRLNENPIDRLDKKSFIKLSTLEVLELNEMDHLEKVYAQTFSYLTGLRVIEMKYNRYLTSIDDRAFIGLFNKTRPVLQELDLEGNKLSVMDRDMVPCAKLKKFNVQKNPWKCDCNLRWIKECDIQQIYEADLKCMYPKNVENAFIFNMNEEDFSCDYLNYEKSPASLHHNRVIKSLTVAITVTFLVAVALGVALTYKWKSITSWYRFKTRGPGAVYYVRARNSPGPALSTNNAS